MLNRWELLFTFLMTVLVFSSMLLDPVVTVSLLMILVLVFVIGRQIERDNHLPDR